MHYERKEVCSHMGLFVNPDQSAFQSALNAQIYVDKSGLIEYTNSVLESTDAFICNSRPRRFGKSITADMLTAYYSRGCDSRDMFSSLKISQIPDWEKHLNKYDVIHFDVQWCMEPAGGPENLVDFITQNTLQELRSLYSAELPENITSLPEALSLINDATQKRFVIIIDEWDVLIRDASADTKIQDSYINFLRGLFKGTLPTRYIALAYLTGILPIKKVQTQSALNNFNEFTMLDARGFAKYIGFTEEEVKTLCDQYHRDFEKVKRWYDGYLLENCQVYNPKAVVEVLRWNKYQSYWSRTGTYDAIVPLINMDFDGLKTAVITMISGSSVEVDVSCFQNDMINFSSKDDVLTYLIHLGYLGYDQNTQSAFIPNEELRQELNDQKMWQLYQEIEIPTAYYLYQMERRGVCADGTVLSEMSAQLQTTVETLEQEIYDLAGEKFNINSPKQLGVILFEKMKLPAGWAIEQKITTVDASTFQMYLTNLKPLFVEMVKGAELVLFNRCEDKKPLAGYRRSVKVVSPQAEVIFEDENGEVDNIFEDEVPYDLKAPVIEIPREDYGIWYIDMQEHPERYKGKVVEFVAKVMKPKAFPSKVFYPGRMAMTCCADDTSFLGYVCRSAYAPKLNAGDWVKIRAKVRYANLSVYGGEGPVLEAENIEPAEPIEELVYFN